MIQSRRAFLKTGAAAAVAWPGLRSLALAGEPAGDALVVVFQRGGCDGLSLLAPVNDADYVADRAPELRVRDDGPKPGRRLAQTSRPPSISACTPRPRPWAICTMPAIWRCCMRWVWKTAPAAISSPRI